MSLNKDEDRKRTDSTTDFTTVEKFASTNTTPDPPPSAGMRKKLSRLSRKKQGGETTVDVPPPSVAEGSLATKPVAFRQLFRFSTKTELVLNVLGLVAAGELRTRVRGRRCAAVDRWRETRTDSFCSHLGLVGRFSCSWWVSTRSVCAAETRREEGARWKRGGKEPSSSPFLALSLAGAAQPLMTLIFGRLTGSFVEVSLRRNVSLPEADLSLLAVHNHRKPDLPEP